MSMPRLQSRYRPTGEQIKLKEKGGNKTVLAGVPASLPSLIKAYRIQGESRQCGLRLAGTGTGVG